MAKFIVSGEQHFGITGQMLEIHRQIRLKGGSPINPELVALALQDIVEGKFHHNKKEDAILRLLSKGETVLIETCDGSETLAQAKEVFKSGIDSDFKDWGLDESDKATEETVVQVHEIIKDATFAQIFGSIGTDLDKLCFTQHQIKMFCKKHSNWLRTEGYGTFFLFKKGDQFFVAYVYVYSDGLLVRVYRFGSGNVWPAQDLRRVVVPQQTA